YYQSEARAFGVNPDHLRKAVEVIHMIAQYPESFMEEISASPDEKYVEKGTVMEIQKGRLSAQGERFRMIMEGMGPEDFENKIFALARSIPGFMDDESIETEEMRPRLRKAVESINSLVKICVHGGADIREAMYKIVRTGYVLKYDLAKICETILGLDNFDLRDIKLIASICDLPNHTHQKRLFDRLPGVLERLYNDEEMSLSEYRGRWKIDADGHEVPSHVIVAYLENTAVDAPTTEANLILEIQTHKNNSLLFRKLSEALVQLGDRPLVFSDYFGDPMVGIGKRIELIKRIGELLNITGLPPDQLFETDPGSFKALKKAVNDKRYSYLANFVKSETGKDIDIAEVKQFEDRTGDLDTLYQFISTLKTGQKDSKISEDKGLTKGVMDRDVKRLAEIVFHMVKGDFASWRNEQKEGTRKEGRRITFMEDDEKFWGEWTREENITKETPGWEKFKRYEAGKELIKQKARVALQEMAEELTKRRETRGDKDLIGEVDGADIAAYVRKIEKTRKVREEIDRHKEMLKALGSAYGKVMRESVIPPEDKDVLAKHGIKWSEKPSDILEAIKGKLEFIEYSLDWLRLMKFRDGYAYAEEYIKAIKRIKKTMELNGVEPEIQKGITDVITDLKISKKKKYNDVEIRTTSDPDVIMKRGALTRFLVNCFQLDGDPRLVRSLIDDLGSRNKMLVTVKADNKYKAVAIAKIKKTAEGKPVIFLERILHLRGSYDFKDEILQVLAVRAQRMGKETQLAKMHDPRDENPVELLSTGGYGEDEYSESHFKLRKNWHKGKDYEYKSKVTAVNIEQYMPAGIELRPSVPAPFDWDKETRKEVLEIAA
ncbi:hypothetical protein ACFLQ8_03600, partial [Candidatus Auribacterota bacterium]